MDMLLAKSSRRAIYSIPNSLETSGHVGKTACFFVNIDTFVFTKKGFCSLFVIFYRSLSLVTVETAVYLTYLTICITEVPTPREFWQGCALPYPAVGDGVFMSLPYHRDRLRGGGGGWVFILMTRTHPRVVYDDGSRFMIILSG